MKSLTVATENIENVSVRAIKRSDASGSIIIEFKDFILDKVFGCEKIGYEMSLEDARKLVVLLDNNISWVAGENVNETH